MKETASSNTIKAKKIVKGIKVIIANNRPLENNLNK
jgi:hypothetical protein